MILGIREIITVLIVSNQLISLASREKVHQKILVKPKTTHYVSNQLISLASRETDSELPIIPDVKFTVYVSNQLISLASRELLDRITKLESQQPRFQSINFPSK